MAMVAMAAALWHPRASSGEREGEVRESQRELGRWAFTKGGRRDATGRQGRGCTRRQWRGASSRMAATHRPRGILWGISANSWRATEWPAWNASLGRLRAEFDNGPNTKFASFLTLYISYLRNQVIRALDQQVIRPQTASVSVLRATSKHSN